MTRQTKFPPGWDEERVRRVLEYCENQNEDEAAFENQTQTIMEIPNELVPAVRELLARHPIFSKKGGNFMEERIIIDPEIQHGKPIIRGTRVPVVRIIGGMAGGMTVEEVCKEYDVSEDDVRAALGYAEELLEAEEVHPLKDIVKPL